MAKSPLMKEQSQIEDMRAAVQGEIERAKERRRQGASRPASALDVPSAEAERLGMGARLAALFRRR